MGWILVEACRLSVSFPLLLVEELTTFIVKY